MPVRLKRGSAKTLTMLDRDILAPNLAQLKAYLAPPPSQAIKLDAMENPYALPDSLKTAWLERLAQVTFNRYPDANAVDLKQALRQRFATAPGWELLLGNGSDEIIQLLCLAVARPGAVVMAPEPSFVMYRHLALACNLQFAAVPLGEDFSLDPAAFVAAIERHQPALVFLAQPNNPTGNVFAESAVRAICEAAPGLVVIDEAYIAFAGGDCAALAAEYGHVLLMRTLSKWGLAGLRLGFLQGPAAWLAELEKLRLPYNINVLTQTTVLFALEHAQVFDQQVELLCAERERVAGVLATLPATRVYPSAANFLLCRQSAAQASTVLAALREAGVLIKNLHGSHPALEGCLRPSIGTPQENDQMLKIWRQALDVG